MINVSMPHVMKMLFLILLLTVFSTGCSTKNINGTKVNSESKLYTEIAKSLQVPCNNPAEFGRCGCTLNGFTTSCAIVNRCLENGFCVRAKK